MLDELSHADSVVVSSPRTTFLRLPELNINLLAVQGLVAPGQQFYWGWDSPYTASCTIIVRDHCMELLYETEQGRQRQCVGVMQAANCFGTRPVFLCPRCKLSYYKLFFWSGQFFCRYCHNVKYGKEGMKSAHNSGSYLSHLPPAPEIMRLWGMALTRDILSTGTQTCSGVFEERAAQKVLSGVERRKLSGNLAPISTGRPSRPLFSYPCTCGVGDQEEGHPSTCPRGKVLYERRRYAARYSQKAKQSQE